jgi:hypothetical protein
MANHCNNHVTFRCTDLQILKQIHNLFTELGKNLSYKQLTLYKELTKEDDEFGTRWIDINNLDDIDNDEFSVSCSSAWAPFLGLTSKLFKLFPECTIFYDYSEPGNDFGGHIEYMDGEVQSDELSYIEYLKKYDNESFMYEVEYRLHSADSNILTSLYEIYKDEYESIYNLYANEPYKDINIIIKYFKVVLPTISDEYLEAFNKYIVEPIINHLKQNKIISKIHAEEYLKMIYTQDNESLYIINELINIKLTELENTKHEQSC